jgi:hypothetical protein
MKSSIHCSSDGGGIAIFSPVDKRPHDDFGTQNISFWRLKLPINRLVVENPSGNATLREGGLLPKRELSRAESNRTKEETQQNA